MNNKYKAVGILYSYVYTRLTADKNGNTVCGCGT